MDKLDYIPGDLVMTKTEPNDFTPNGVVCEFVSYCNRNKVFVRVAKGIDTFFLEKEQITPIPLTPEILEKNGWDKEEKDGSVFSLSEAFMGGNENDEDNYTCFQLYYQNKKDGWVIDIRGEPLKFEIHYIHELQHLLFGFGINHEMEV